MSVKFDEENYPLIEWVGPDHNGGHQAEFGKLILSIHPLNDQFEWDISTHLADFSLDAGTSSGVDEAKRIIRGWIRDRRLQYLA